LQTKESHIWPEAKTSIWNVILSLQARLEYEKGIIINVGPWRSRISFITHINIILLQGLYVKLVIKECFDTIDSIDVLA
jgi:hypothetical protein